MKSKKVIIFSFASFILSTLMLIGSTFAWFTNGAPVISNVVHVGNVQLDVDLYQVVSGMSYEMSTLMINNMKPGDVVRYHLDIHNSGSISGELNVGFYGFLDYGSIAPISEVITLNYSDPLVPGHILNGTISTLISNDEIPLISAVPFAPNASCSLDFTFTFHTSAGNDYQNGSLSIQSIYVSLYQVE